MSQPFGRDANADGLPDSERAAPSPSPKIRPEDASLGDDSNIRSEAGRVLSDLKWWPPEPEMAVTTVSTVPHHKHSWAKMADDERGAYTGCLRCPAVLDPAKSRQGKSSLRAGKDAERAIAKAYPGGKRTGMYGGPDDVTVGDLLIVQSKAGKSWFSKKVWDELQKLPRTGGRIPMLAVSDRPGTGGGSTRRYVVLELRDHVALMGRDGLPEEAA